MQDVRDMHDTRRESTRFQKILTRHTRVRRKYFRKCASKGFTFVKKRDII